jgi:hypothetical protein
LTEILEKVRLAALGLDGPLPELVNVDSGCNSRTGGPGGGGIKGVLSRTASTLLDDANIVAISGMISAVRIKVEVGR